MRDVLISLFIVGALPTCFRRPFIGLLLFSLLAYMRVQDLTWGFARYQRWSYYIAIVTAAGYILGKGEKRLMVRDTRCWMMLALVALVGVSMLASDTHGSTDVSIYIEFLKIILVALFTTVIVKNRDYLRILVWLIALSFGFFGLKGGIQFILSGGGMKIIAGPGGMISDNNDFGLALCMGLPLLYSLGIAERRQHLRRILLAIVPLTMMTIIATYSRGAFLSMCTVMLVLVWRSQNRLAGLAAGLLLATAGAMIVPQSFIDRLSTIKEYETEGSAAGRLAAWKTAGVMIQRHPVFGVGFEQFQANYTSYDPLRLEGRASGTRVTHNTYLQFWAECGTPVFLLFIGLIALTFVDLWKIRREAARRYHSSWILSYATMFEASLAAFCCGAMFLNRANFDLFYHLVAIVIVFGRIAREAMRDESNYPTKLGGRGVLVAVERRDFNRKPARRGFGQREGEPVLGGF